MDPGGAAPIHEMASGEWAFGVGYNGMYYWLEPCFVYPDWRTNSNFIVETPINCPGDLDGDGVHECHSIISNPDLRIRIDYDFEKATDGVNYGTAMGRGTLGPNRADTAYRLSDKWVMIQSFDVENISGGQLDDLRLSGMVAGHPANTEYGGIDVAFDTTTYAVGGFQDYNYDLTAFATNSGLTDGANTGSLWDDAISYSLNFTPTAWDIDLYQGHEFGDPGITSDPVDANANGLKPLCGTHCNIENNTMNGSLQALQGEYASGFSAEFGDLPTGQSLNVDVMLSVASDAIGLPAEACLELTETGGDPSIGIGKGACAGATPTVGTFQVMMGSLHQLSRVADCGTGPNGPIDCTALVNPVCKAHTLTENRLALDEDAHITDALFYLARQSGTNTPWGFGNNVATDLNDLYRFYFSPTTASGIDVCQPYAAAGRSAIDVEQPDAIKSPGVGRLEAVGLGTASPRREQQIRLP